MFEERTSPVAADFHPAYHTQGKVGAEEKGALERKVIPRRLHFVGIGGVGMSGLALLLQQRGHEVTGSDTGNSRFLSQLRLNGIQVYREHAPSNLPADTDLVVVTSAIKPDNPEWLAARERGVPVIRRGELLAWLLSSYQTVAVAGAHGKTTTTAMVASVLLEGGLDPSVLVGGYWSRLEGNYRLGRSPYFVTEADESDASFLLLNPLVAVVTNIENDHLDYYGDQAAIIQAFRCFLRQVPPTGVAVACVDSPLVAELLREPGLGTVVTYGMENPADYTLSQIELSPRSSSALLHYRGKLLGQLRLSLPGKHNLLNAVAALAVGLHLGVPLPTASRALATFTSVGRRFEFLGEAGGVMVVDDYAHHPTEVQATITAARQVHKGRLVVVFQPHRYTRTALLYSEFSRALAGADVVVLDEIYSAGETPLPGVTADLIAQACRSAFPELPLYQFPSKGKADFLREIVAPGDLVLTMGAGDVHLIGKELLSKLEGAQ
ncbi:UDP-N-acetylmuramate--L-alanine ligase [Desulfothermobacter acidiphilus]|uniref:UDP-N-acetylmuramate--L-alanine ligase n=1 Tax=Desulfothermobacter acidiphilus TaxID=1938353 RepID=UPI003F8C5E82